MFSASMFVCISVAEIRSDRGPWYASSIFRLFKPEIELTPKVRKLRCFKRKIFSELGEQIFPRRRNKN